MSPFDKYMQESKEIRKKYDILIAANPSNKPQLLVEMQKILLDMLDKCEKEEQEVFKRKDELAEIK